MFGRTFHACRVLHRAKRIAYETQWLGKFTEYKEKQLIERDGDDPQVLIDVQGNRLTIETLRNPLHSKCFRYPVLQ